MLWFYWTAAGWCCLTVVAVKEYRQQQQHTVHSGQQQQHALRSGQQKPTVHQQHQQQHTMHSH